MIITASLSHRQTSGGALLPAPKADGAAADPAPPVPTTLRVSLNKFVFTHRHSVSNVIDSIFMPTGVDKGAQGAQGAQPPNRRAKKIF